VHVPELVHVVGPNVDDIDASEYRKGHIPDVNFMYLVFDMAKLKKYFGIKG